MHGELTLIKIRSSIRSHIRYDPRERIEDLILIRLFVKQQQNKLIDFKNMICKL